MCPELKQTGRNAPQMNEVLLQVYLVGMARPLGRSTDSTLHTDIPLTERGEHAAQELSARWKDLSFAKIFTKPPHRAHGQPSRLMCYVR